MPTGSPKNDSSISVCHFFAVMPDLPDVSVQRLFGVVVRCDLGVESWETRLDVLSEGSDRMGAMALGKQAGGPPEICSCSRTNTSAHVLVLLFYLLALLPRGRSPDKLQRIYGTARCPRSGATFLANDIKGCSIVPFRGCSHAPSNYLARNTVYVKSSLLPAARTH